tara:strand:+ start:29159 stop:30352 length:1194 start_codon:yes stop_codon:yes gene_type:complete
MRKRSTSWFLRRFILISTLLLSFHLFAVDLNEDLNENKKLQLDNLKKNIKLLQRRLEGSQGKYLIIHEKLKSSELKIAYLSRRLKALNNKYLDSENFLKKLRKEKLKRQTSLIRQIRIFEKQIQSTYAIGRQSKIKIILDQKGPSEISRALVYFNYLNKEKSSQINDLKKSIKNIENTKDKIETQKNSLKQIIKEQELKKSEIRKAQKQRQKIAKSLKNKINSDDLKLEVLRNEERQLQKLLDGISDTIDRNQIQSKASLRFASFRGKLNWPTTGFIKHTFGETKIGRLKWDGVIIKAKNNQSVDSIHPGRVVFADWLRGFGLLIIIDHGDGFLSLYGHNKRLLKDVGEFVEASEAIAIVGNTGGKKDIGIYFAIRKNGEAINPSLWCSKTKGRFIK